MKRLLITGTREGWPQDRLEFCLGYHYGQLGAGDVVLVHGAAQGVDSQAAAIWTVNGLPTEPHPARWDLHGKGAGPMRNQEMVNLGADLCVAFILQGRSRGTKDCVMRAELAGITTHTYERR